MKSKVQQLSGEVLKTFGASGGLVIKLHSDSFDSFDIKEPVFVEFDGLQVPFYFESLEQQGRKAVVTFSDMGREEWAGELVGKRFTYGGIAKTDTPANNELSLLIGYKVHDKELGTIGEICDFYDYPSNPCLEMDYNNEKFLIPVNDELIPEIDIELKILHTNLPKGLLDL